MRVANSILGDGQNASLYEDLIIEFTPAISTLPSCGDITYEVIDLATGNPLVIFKAEIDTGV